MWNEALNQAGVEASSTLSKAESAYYPPAFQASGSSGPKANAASKEADIGKESPAIVLPLVQSSSKEAKLSKGAEKPVEVTKEMAYNAIMPLANHKDPFKENEAPQNMEIVLATLPIPIKEVPKGKGLASSMADTTQPGKTQKDKLVIKIKPRVIKHLFLFMRLVISSPFLISLRIFINFCFILVLFLWTL